MNCEAVSIYCVICTEAISQPISGEITGHMQKICKKASVEKSMRNLCIIHKVRMTKCVGKNVAVFNNELCKNVNDVYKNRVFCCRTLNDGIFHEISTINCAAIGKPYLLFEFTKAVQFITKS